MNLLRDLTEYTGKYYSHEYIRKQVLRQSEDQIREIDDQIAKEQDDVRYQVQQQDTGGGGGRGNFFNEYKPDEEKPLITEDIDRKIEEKFELAKQDKEIKDTVSEVFASILEDNDEDLKDTLTEVFDSVRK